MVGGVSGTVAYIDDRFEEAQRSLNRARDVPVSGLATGPARALIGGGQLITAVGLSSLRLTQVQEDRWEYMVWDGLDRASRATANIVAGVWETVLAGTLLLNPVALAYSISEYANRQNHR